MRILQYLKSNHRRAGVICSLILLTAGLVPLVIFTFFADLAHPYSIEHVELTSVDGTKIQAIAYTPLGVTGNHPGIVVGHGFTGNKVYMQPLSIELVKRGWTVISIDFRGHGSSGGYLLADRLNDAGLEDDMTVAMNYLVGLGNIDKIGLIGHSMGGRTALRVAEEKYGWVNGTVSIGMVQLDYNFTRIPNLLMAVGQLDQVNNAETEIKFLKNYTGLSDVVFDNTYGDFAKGNACKVAIAPLGEHLFEPLNTAIITETVTWLEQVFNGSVPTDVTITAGFHTTSFLIAMAGAVCLVFMALLYLSNALWKGGSTQPERYIVKNTSGAKLVIHAILAYGIGGGLLFPLSGLFSGTMSVAMGNMLFAVLVGNAIGLMVIFFLLVLRKEDRNQIPDLFGKMRQACGSSPGRSFCFGILAAILSACAITSIMEWSSTTTILTAREYGTAFSIAILFFPFLFIKEFYFRGVQGRLSPANRVKEYGKMTGIGLFIDNVVLVPVAILVWQNSNHEVAFLALAITAFVGFNAVHQLLTTWVYMHSGRSILGSTVFFCVFYAWMIVNFFPFALN